MQLPIVTPGRSHRIDLTNQVTNHTTIVFIFKIFRPVCSDGMTKFAEAQVLPPVPGTPNSFTRGIFIWVIQRIGQEWQPLIFTVYFPPPDLSQNGFIGTKADRVLIAWRNFPVSIGPPSARPKTALRAVQRPGIWNTLPTIVAYLARHGCYSHQ